VFLGGLSIRKPSIASGGQGDIYRAWDPIDRRDLVVKSPRVSVSDLNNGSINSKTQSILREAHLLKGITHPNIIPLLGCCSNAVINGDKFKDVPCLVFEYVENGNAWDFFDERFGAIQGLRIQAITEIAQALAYLHDLSIVHGDIKPHNVLVDCYFKTILCDFGSAKHVSECAYRGSTKSYAAPEIRSEGLPSSVESDVYSFALTALQLCTGSHLKGMTLSKTYIAPGPIQGLILRCLDFNPRKRPTMSDVVDVLLSFKDLVIRPNPARLLWRCRSRTLLRLSLRRSFDATKYPHRLQTRTKSKGAAKGMTLLQKGPKKAYGRFI